MTDAPLAYTVHPGGPLASEELQHALTQWLRANGINPSLVSVDAPISVLPLPHPGPDGQTWLIQVIVLEQFHIDHLGAKEINLITGRPVTFQRTIPLTVPFPNQPATGAEHQTDGGPAGSQSAADEGLDQQGEAVADTDGDAETAPDEAGGQ
ncbi:hypothetical protein [Streptomyces cylindrosporus]|uniref:Uncharacterized protein n=1 Tax=Streptomyces cylindrosporus TaxID=2927583 RepID=A0ABS9YP98_9ACTN|nr:hypothetical protein [Streptomyces cylindrosporus]MCI3279095.1 hypothetical protein [Streptomyces cylindrosporus]